MKIILAISLILNAALWQAWRLARCRALIYKNDRRQVGDLNPPSPQSSPHPEPIKPLTLTDLKRQVDECSNWWGRSLSIGMNDLSKDQIWIIGDFEIRRRK